MSSERTEAFFDHYAADFDGIYNRGANFYRSLINRIFRASMILRFQKTLEGCQPITGKTVLDIGCGPGRYGIALAQRGAGSVLGIDFAGGMLSLATERAHFAGVAGRCRFQRHNLFEFEPNRTFDYLILMGFMDYMPEPKKVIDKVLSLTRGKAFLSFPAAGGFIAWQRKLRYRKRCDLFLYTSDQIRELFAEHPEIYVTIERIRQDFFVTIHMPQE